MIRVEDLHMRFGGIHAVDGASIEIARGSITGLIGPNGAGKSTLVNLLSGEIGVSGGSILLDGADVTRLPVHARVKQEAMARGLMVYPMGGTIDGRLGDHVLLAPPYIVTTQEIGQIVDRLGEAVDASIAALAGGSH